MQKKFAAIIFQEVTEIKKKSNLIIYGLTEDLIIDFYEVHYHLLPLHAVKVCHCIADGVHSNVAHVEATGRVGKHGQHVELVAITQTVFFR